MLNPNSLSRARFTILLSVCLLFLPALACGSSPAATPTPTATSAPPTETPVPVSQSAAVTSTSETLASVVGAAIVDRMWEDALVFVLANGTATATADQLTGGLLGLLQRLSMWVSGQGGETAPVDCQAVLPGVIARSDNPALLNALLAACESGDRALVSSALAPLRTALEPH